MRRKTIVATGDLILNTNLFAKPANPNLSSGPWPTPHREDMVGGSHYLYDLIRLSYLKAKNQPEVLLADHPELIPEQAISLWLPFDKKSGDPSAGKVWRIASTYQASFPQRDNEATNEVEAAYKAYIKALSTSIDEPHGGDYSNADVLVIDDANLGYRSSYQALSGVNKTSLPSCQIVLKTRHPIYEDPDNGSSGLWNYLSQEPDFKERLTIVISTESLRLERVAVNHARSWDQLLEELSSQMAIHPLKELNHAAQRIVVSIPAAGIAVFVEGKLTHFICHPSELEDQWLARHPGRTEGSTSILAAAVCRALVEYTDFRRFDHYGRNALAAMRYSHEEGGGAFKDEKDEGSTWYQGYLSNHIEAVAQRLSDAKIDEFASFKSKADENSNSGGKFRNGVRPGSAAQLHKWLQQGCDARTWHQHGGAGFRAEQPESAPRPLRKICSDRQI